jgi:hypothetical protein
MNNPSQPGGERPVVKIPEELNQEPAEGSNNIGQDNAETPKPRQNTEVIQQIPTQTNIVQKPAKQETVIGSNQPVAPTTIKDPNKLNEITSKDIGSVNDAAKLSNEIAEYQVD